MSPSTSCGHDAALALGSFVPKRHMQCSKLQLFDQRIGTQQERFRDFQAERLGRGQIDDKIEFGRLLDRKIGGFCAAQNLVDKVGGAAKQVGEVWTIGWPAAPARHRSSVAGQHVQMC